MTRITRAQFEDARARGWNLMGGTVKEECEAGGKHRFRRMTADDLSYRMPPGMYCEECYEPAPEEEP
jgi:hypothetical protein